VAADRPGSPTPSALRQADRPSPARPTSCHPSRPTSGPSHGGTSFLAACALPTLVGRAQASEPDLGRVLDQILGEVPRGRLTGRRVRRARCSATPVPSASSPPDVSQLPTMGDIEDVGTGDSVRAHPSTGLLVGEHGLAMEEKRRRVASEQARPPRRMRGRPSPWLAPTMAVWWTGMATAGWILGADLPPSIGMTVAAVAFGASWRGGGPAQDYDRAAKADEQGRAREVDMRSAPAPSQNGPLRDTRRVVAVRGGAAAARRREPP
jgi:hypothetical protein